MWCEERGIKKYKYGECWIFKWNLYNGGNWLRWWFLISPSISIYKHAIMKVSMASPSEGVLLPLQQWWSWRSSCGSDSRDHDANESVFNDLIKRAEFHSLVMLIEFDFGAHKIERDEIDHNWAGENYLVPQSVGIEFKSLAWLNSKSKLVKSDY